MLPIRPLSSLFAEILLESFDLLAEHSSRWKYVNCKKGKITVFFVGVFLGGLPRLKSNLATSVFLLRLNEIVDLFLLVLCKLNSLGKVPEFFLLVHALDDILE